MAKISLGSFDRNTEEKVSPSPVKSPGSQITIKAVTVFKFSVPNYNEYYRGASPNKVIPATLTALELSLIHI